MERIPLEKLREMWKREGPFGEWRKLLASSPHASIPHFEFGVLPEKDPKYGTFRIVLDHEAAVRLVPVDNPLRGEFVIRPDAHRAGEVDVEESPRSGLRLHTFFVSADVYAAMLADAAAIHDEYGDPETGSFWSIPSEWFADTTPIRFIGEHIVSSHYYRSRPRGRNNWYWP